MRCPPDSLPVTLRIPGWFSAAMCARTRIYIAPAIFLGQKTSADDPVRHLLDSMAENTRLRRQLSAETEARLRSFPAHCVSELAPAVP